MWDALSLPLLALGMGIAVALLFHGWPSFINVTHIHNHSSKDNEE